MSNQRRISERRVAGLLGLAFDAHDGHKRITHGNNFLLAGRSEQTRGLMRDTILKVNEELDARGLDLADVSAEELRDILDDLEAAGLVYFDEYFELSGNWPPWIRLYVADR